MPKLRLPALAAVSLLLAAVAFGPGAARGGMVVSPAQEPWVRSTFHVGEVWDIGGCTLGGIGIEQTHLKIQLACGDGTHTLVLRHTSEAADGDTVTAQFAIHAEEPAPPTAALEALVTQVKQTEGEWQWLEVGKSPEEAAASLDDDQKEAWEKARASLDLGRCTEAIPLLIDLVNDASFAEGVDPLAACVGDEARVKADPEQWKAARDGGRPVDALVAGIALYTLGRHLEDPAAAKGYFEDAVPRLRKARDAFGDRDAILGPLALSLHSLGQTDEARAMVKGLGRPDDPDVLMLSAELTWPDDPKAALEIIQKAIEVVAARVDGGDSGGRGDLERLRAHYARLKVVAEGGERTGDLRQDMEPPPAPFVLPATVDYDGAHPDRFAEGLESFHAGRFEAAIDVWSRLLGDELHRRTAVGLIQAIGRAGWDAEKVTALVAAADAGKAPAAPAAGDAEGPAPTSGGVGGRFVAGIASYVQARNPGFVFEDKRHHYGDAARLLGGLPDGLRTLPEVGALLAIARYRTGETTEARALIDGIVSGATDAPIALFARAEIRHDEDLPGAAADVGTYLEKLEALQARGFNIPAAELTSLRRTKADLELFASGAEPPREVFDTSAGETGKSEITSSWSPRRVVFLVGLGLVLLVLAFTWRGDDEEEDKPARSESNPEPEPEAEPEPEPAPEPEPDPAKKDPDPNH